MRARFLALASLVTVVAFLSPVARASSPLAAPSFQPRDQKPLALVGGMLLTGYDVPPVHHAAVVIEGDRIVAAGPASAIAIPPAQP